MVGKIAAAFRDKYLGEPGALFDRERIDALIGRVMQRGPTFRQDSRHLIECMAVSVFETQCRNASQASARARRYGEVLTVVEPAQWPGLESALAAPALRAATWRADERVRLREGVTVVTAHRTGPTVHYAFLVQDLVAGHMEAPATHSWLSTFLKHIGTAATSEFTVQDWIDELDAGFEEFRDMLDILAQQGVILPAEAAGFSSSADTSPKPDAVAHLASIQVVKEVDRSSDESTMTTRASRAAAVAGSDSTLAKGD
jgi:hypothetical protein